MRAAPGMGRSLKADMVTAAVVPLLIFALGAAGTMYWLSRTHQEQRIRAKLDTIVTLLAQSNELGFLTESSDNFSESVRSALNDADIVHVAIYNREGQPILADGRAEVAPLVQPLELVESADTSWRPLSDGLYEVVRLVRYPAEEDSAEQLAFRDADPEDYELELGPPEGVIRVVMSSARVRAEYRDMLLSSSAAMAVVLVLGIGLALELSRPTLRDIRQLVGASHRIGHGDLAARVPDLGRGELAELGQEFNQMTEQLRQARDELDAHQLMLEQRVVERTSELNAARIEADRANLAKTHFLANMSHEIRTPLTAILGYTDLLLDVEAQVPAEGRSQLEIVKRNGSHLLEIINDILDLSKIEAGRLEVERIPMSLIHVVAEIGSLMRVRAQQKNIALSIEFEDELPEQVLADPVRVRQAIMNLVVNAIKFTDSGQVRIVVSWNTDNQLAFVHVIDTGPGIAEGSQPSLFLQFEQADTTTSRRFGGTGLGLAIARRVAILLDGDCTVQSELGKGSTFSFSFRAPPAPGSRMVRPADEAELGGINEAAAALSTLPEGTRILLAEDGPDNQRLIRAVLRKAGAAVQVAENGLVAVQLVEQGSFDLVLMDMAMPEMDGYTATRTLRDMGVDLPIVALTAHALSGERDKCLAAGCDDYLTKPIDRAELIARIAEHLRAKRD